MGRRGKRSTPEQIVAKLRAIEKELASGALLADAVRSVDISEQTYYRWKKRYGRVERDELKRLKKLEKENDRLKKLVAELSLDKSILEEALKGKH